MSVLSDIPTPEGMQFPTIESIFGPFLIGVVFSAALWGVTCVQTYDYYMTPNEDSLLQKSVVGVLLIIDTFDLAMNIHALYYYLVKNYGNAEALLISIWSVSCRALVIVLASFIVRTMFARRIYLVSGKNVILTLWIMAISTSDLVVGILISAKSLISPSTQGQNISHLLYIGFSLGVASDVSVTIALYWLLHSLRTGIRKTDSIIKVLVRYVVTTGLLVCIDATLGLILYIVMPDNLVFLAFFILLGKLYINTYLASLNTREKLSKGQTDLAISLSRMSYQPRHRQTTVTTEDNTTSLQQSNNSVVVRFKTSTERREDDHELKNLGSSNAV